MNYAGRSQDVFAGHGKANLSAWGYSQHFVPYLYIGSYLIRLSHMIGTPYTSDTLIPTLDRLRHPPQFLAIRTPQQQDFLHDLVGVHVPHAHRFRPSVNVCACDDRMSARSRRDGNLDGGMLVGEGGKARFNECAVEWSGGSVAWQWRRMENAMG